MSDIYTDKGYKNRSDYLRQLATDYNVELYVVTEMANLYGTDEDFDGLVSSLRDMELILQ